MSKPTQMEFDAAASKVIMAFPAEISTIYQYLGQTIEELSATVDVLDAERAHVLAAAAGMAGQTIAINDESAKRAEAERKLASAERRLRLVSAAVLGGGSFHTGGATLSGYVSLSNEVLNIVLYGGKNPIRNCHQCGGIGYKKGDLCQECCGLGYAPIPL